MKPLRCESHLIITYKPPLPSVHVYRDIAISSTFKIIFKVSALNSKALVVTSKGWITFSSKIFVTIPFRTLTPAVFSPFACRCLNSVTILMGFRPVVSGRLQRGGATRSNRGKMGLYLRSRREWLGWPRGRRRRLGRRLLLCRRGCGRILRGIGKLRFRGLHRLQWVPWKLDHQTGSKSRKIAMRGGFKNWEIV